MADFLAKKRKMCYTEDVLSEKTDFRKFKGKRICVACSGGADSLCLLHYLKSRESVDGFSLSAVHCEHGIRGAESKADAAFVENFCKERGIPLFTFSDDCVARAAREKISLETAARKFRYECFDSLLAEGKADVVATAHHKDDDAETVLFHLLRGASLTGAGGMREARNGYIRPFLNVSKQEIYGYAKEHGLDFCTDATNFATDASRNRLRLEAMPLLESIVPKSADNLVRFAKIAQKDDALLYGLAEKLVEKKTGFEGAEAQAIVKFAEQPLFYRACVLAMKHLGLEQDYSYAHLSALEKLFFDSAGQTGKFVCLPHGIRARRRYDELVFYREGESFERKGGASGERFRCGEFDFSDSEILVTKEKCEAEIFSKTSVGHKILRADARELEGSVLRGWKTGDVFAKFGGGTKTLKKYLTDRKIPAAERESVALFCKGSEVLLIVGTEISKKVRVEEDAKDCVYIAVRKKDGRENR